MTSVRRATLDDVEAIRVVALLTWPPTYLPLAGSDYVMDGLTRWWAADVVRRGIESDSTWVAELDGAVVGVAVAGESQGRTWLWKLYVLPIHHGHGVGAALMSAVLEGVGDGALWLSYLDGNERARRFYSAWAFEPAGELKVAGGFGYPVLVRTGSGCGTTGR